ncbi:MAG: EpsI family protein [Candidatus Omnitrophica bacterium]|nr:EpsI family protein [Candidatus Omnitrophota bacterium]
MDKKFLIIISLLFFGVIGTMLFKLPEIDSSSDARISNVPQQIGEYSGTDIELKDEIYAMLETENIVMRAYEKKAQPLILFYLIFSKATHKTSDPPENCLQGDGYSVLNKAKVSIPINMDGKEFDLIANKLIVGKTGDNKLYLYWFLAGNEFQDSYFKQRLKLISAFLKRKPLSGGQIRISIDIENNDQNQALVRLESFIQQIIPHLKPLLQ